MEENYRAGNKKLSCVVCRVSCVIVIITFTIAVRVTLTFKRRCALYSRARCPVKNFFTRRPASLNSRALHARKIFHATRHRKMKMAGIRQDFVVDVRRAG
jgi:hypothetical protein